MGRGLRGHLTHLISVQAEGSDFIADMVASGYIMSNRRGGGGTTYLESRMMSRVGPAGVSRVSTKSPATRPRFSWRGPFYVPGDFGAVGGVWNRATAASMMAWLFLLRL